jgi:hypothetical protein
MWNMGEILGISKERKATNGKWREKGEIIRICAPLSIPKRTGAEWVRTIKEQGVEIWPPVVEEFLLEDIGTKEGLVNVAILRGRNADGKEMRKQGIRQGFLEPDISIVCRLIEVLNVADLKEMDIDVIAGMHKISSDSMKGWISLEVRQGRLCVSIKSLDEFGKRCGCAFIVPQPVSPR